MVDIEVVIITYDFTGLLELIKGTDVSKMHYLIFKFDFFGVFLDFRLYAVSVEDNINDDIDIPWQ